MTTAVVEALVSRIRRHGPIGFDQLMELALYGDDGFFAAHGRAGRRGDFLTSPEVGPLFGAIVARALDTWWDDLGRPDPFTVVEVGAGVGTLAVAVRAAEPACLPALTYVLVERSPALRQRQADHLPLDVPAMALPPNRADDEEAPVVVAGGGPRFTSLADLPAGPLTGVVLANELLDNLPFRVLERTSAGWREVVCALTGDAPPLVEVLVPVPEDVARVADHLAAGSPLGGRIPLATGATAWLRRCLEVVRQGRVVVVDYGASTLELASRRAAGWLRTYRAHERGGPVLDSLGQQDITADVPFDQLALVLAPTEDEDQASWLRRFGLDDLVAAGRRTWEERAHIGDLAALRARSRIREAEALVDPDGLGAFRVLEWRR